MAAPQLHSPAPRLATRSTDGRSGPSGAWWPESRSLSDELSALFAQWPAEQGRITRVLYSPPDWDDHPHSVTLPDRRVKTGAFPRDDTHQLVLSMLDGSRRVLTVIPPQTEPSAARAQLAAFTSTQD